MGLESASYIDDLNVSNPDGASDPKSQGDNHLRLLKTVLKATFPGLAGRSWRTQSKSGNYTALTTDNMTLLLFTAAATLSLTAAATLGNGWMGLVYAYGGAVTIDPNSSEQINDASSLSIPAGKAAIVFCDGSEVYAFELAVPGNTVPVGTVQDFAGGTAPTGYLLCYGQAVSRTTYAALYSVLGNNFGAGDGSTTFNVPDCRGRTSFGKDDMGGSAASRLTAGVSGITGTSLGSAGGDQNAPAHSHTGSASTSISDPTHAHTEYGELWANLPGHQLQPVGGGGVYGTTTSVGPRANVATLAAPTGITASTSVTINSAGSGGSGNVPPGIVFNKIIKY